jgi:hypothetical protein
MKGFYKSDTYDEDIGGWAYYLGEFKNGNFDGKGLWYNYTTGR